MGPEKKTAALSVRVPPALKEAVAALAREERRPVSATVELLLEEALAARRRAPPRPRDRP